MLEKIKIDILKFLRLKKDRLNLSSEEDQTVTASIKELLLHHSMAKYSYQEVL